MLIRRERSVDTTAVAGVHRSAFAAHYAATGGDTAHDPPEVALLDALRSDPGWIPTLSMVAVADEAVVGHVCLTRATVGPFPVLALGPIAVLADRQHRGVGSALIHAVAGAADALDEPLIGLLGSPDYYPRFGFQPGERLGIVPDRPDRAGLFQVRPLTAYDSQIVGEFRYTAAFYGL
ncbi:N-acetyltransferase [Nocardia flavorosea]|uniref:GNAT family N-acetyltransferase n=1 Tax=Nocardia flavorosea TaxID=53429 RepID=UPI001895B5D1|nr:N-acetyltransferase [Nocardia flavorosea]MBF6352611.1 N-acetyltransferase [Nocardia flavorosea]